ncbi:MAG: DUF1972 domain-containing protein [Streptococcaceae bacterium]|jgi:glycosyltransferase involved in cell wall biosynthesis|nr:DUF1972 domain-containing protein [Streptococcaceae bacterium]
MKNKLKISIIGTQGIPAKYGGFETLVENIVNNQKDNIEYTVFCSAQYFNKRPEMYKGARLNYIRLNANGAQSIPYDIVSMMKSLKEYDILLVLGVSGCLALNWIKRLCKGKIIVNIDGLEQRRNKWNIIIKEVIKYAERIALKHADAIIADNKVIHEYIKVKYGKEAHMISYGGDHVLCDTSRYEENIVKKYNIEKYNYSFSVCRIEPENNIHTILKAYAENGEKLLFVGNWNCSKYGKNLFEKYRSFPGINLLPPNYNLIELNVLRSNCKFYIHGHSVGGTNPSLVEAMFFGRPVLAYDCLFNRETTEYKAHYFKNEDQLNSLVVQDYNTFLQNAIDMFDVANSRYTWKTIVHKYEELYNSILANNEL